MIFFKDTPSEITLRTLLKHAGHHRRNIDASSLKVFKDKLSDIFNAHGSDNELTIVLPSFPYKSINTTDKVMSALPDLGEEVALARIEKLRKTLARKLKTPVKFIICSDGFAFNDLKGIPDSNVLDYRKHLISMASLYPHIDVKSLYDLIPDISSENRIEALMSGFGASSSALKKSIVNDTSLATLYNNLTIFAKHDLRKHDDESKKAFRIRCKEVAFNMVSRSDAWANLIADRYPNAIRLSIHPYKDVSKKFPIALIPSVDGRWRTPWHNVPVITGSTPFNTAVKLSSRKDAIKDGAHLNYKNGHPWCYTSRETKTMEEVMKHSFL